MIRPPWKSAEASVHRRRGSSLTVAVFDARGVAGRVNFPCFDASRLPGRVFYFVLAYCSCEVSVPPLGAILRPYFVVPTPKKSR